MHISELELVTRVLVGWGLTFVLGFERAVRGAPAGDRTFSLVGAGTALIGALSLSSPAVLGGAVTGIGFIGGGLCFRQAAQDKEILHGVTTAASIFCAAAIGAAAGVGHLWLAAIATGSVFISLEIRHLPVFRLLDARRWAPYFHHDDHAHFTLRGIEKAIVHEVEGEAVDVKRMSLAACGHTVPSQALSMGDGGGQHGGVSVMRIDAVCTECGEPVAQSATAALSDEVEQAIEADIAADQIVEAAASAARGGTR
ncbi:MAG TPA: MgtC/SapB family protein [Actinocrinis sp.]|uniref:MgtC/SapB family protein n=1 Tax=Actinocrinis sp. TaxID=1920516 RepID=UPI002D5B847C|nr:MgtC/SapB family protein [Actinocrinis sp.]HZU56642.1 MgtC/SapB family protein [Actinocrinis sp.]